MLIRGLYATFHPRCVVLIRICHVCLTWLGFANSHVMLLRGVYRCVTSGHAPLLFTKLSALLADHCKARVSLSFCYQALSTISSLS
jgi:hypothetical protein